MGEWQFSESSLPLLERCIEAAGQPGTDWLKLFKPNYIQPENSFRSRNIKREDSVSSDASTVIMNTEDVTENQKENSKEANEEKIENIRATIELQPSNKLEYLINQCVIYDNVLPVLAGKLTAACVETICADLFAKNICPSFIDKFYTQFFPAYIKQDGAFGSLELLMRAHKAHPSVFKNLIVLWLIDCDMPNKLLESFIATIGHTECYEALQLLTTKELSPEAFIQHLNTINCLYKNSPKTVDVQEFILQCLISSANHGRNDKNYGRLLLAYFQTLKDSDVPINRNKLQQLVSTHATPFARRCSNILDNLK